MFDHVLRVTKDQNVFEHDAMMDYLCLPYRELILFGSRSTSDFEITDERRHQVISILRKRRPTYISQWKGKDPISGSTERGHVCYASTLSLRRAVLSMHDRVLQVGTYPNTAKDRRRSFRFSVLRYDYRDAVSPASSLRMDGNTIPSSGDPAENIMFRNAFCSTAWMPSWNIERGGKERGRICIARRRFSPAAGESKQRAQTLTIRDDIPSFCRIVQLKSCEVIQFRWTWRISSW